MLEHQSSDQRRGAGDAAAVVQGPAAGGLPSVVGELLLAAPRVSFRELVTRLEAEMRLAPGCSEGPPPRHHFARGVYARELRIPADMLVLGKVHRHSQINMVLAGEISVYSEEGVRLCKAGDVIVSPPGVQRVGYAHTDTIWVTVHGTHATDLERLEEELILPWGEALPSAQLLVEEN